MNKNKVLAGILAVVLVVGGAVLLFGGSPKVENQQQAAEQSGAGTGTVTSGDGNIQAEIQVEAPKTFTLAEVATHNSAASCYTAVNGGVYDATGFIGKHPGGEENILKLCGKDGSTFFNKQHGGQAKAEAALASLKIGVLTQ